MRKLNIKSILCFLLAAASIFLWGSAGADNGKIELEVSGTGANTVLKIATNDVKCGNDKNCIQTQKGRHLDLDFDLPQACNPNPGAPAYRLSEMQFSMVQRQPQAPGSDVMVKAFGMYVLPAIVMSDFGTNTSGFVQWTPPNDLKDHKIKIKNKNEGEYVVYYQIKASKCPGSTVVGPQHIYLDPSVKNTGR